MERSCQVQLLAQAAGKPVSIDHESAVLTKDQIGSDLAGWVNYQPLTTGHADALVGAYDED
jgi:hypothetical protein